jgi:hypothetical protein
MAKKRAFVRYSKNGKLVPGSLIVTQGTHPDKPSTWKEVPYDICCDDNGNDCTLVPISTDCNNFEALPSEYGFILIFRANNNCSGFQQQQYLQILRDFPYPISNAQDVVDLINSDVVCQENGVTAVLNTSDPDLTCVSISISKCKCLYTSYGSILAIVGINTTALPNPNN